MTVRPFLTADWRRLLMLSYRIGRAVIEPRVPAGTELDAHDGVCYASLVGFAFERTRVRGLAVPFHTRFAEVNLRFYVRRRADEGWRRGVVFVKEVVPRRAIAVLARWLYNEPYTACPMRSSDAVSAIAAGAAISYAWRHDGRWNRIAGCAEDAARPLAPGSLEAFIAEHYWGYTRQRDGGTLEYRVEHPSWRGCPARDVVVDVDVPAQYGPEFAPWLLGAPASALLVEGSAVSVWPGVRVA